MPLQAEIRFKAKTIVTSLSSGIYSDLMSNTCVIMFFNKDQVLPNDDMSTLKRQVSFISGALIFVLR